MGYTHYFDQQKTVPVKEWNLICEDFNKCRLAAMLDKAWPIQYEYDNPQPVEVSSKAIRFNGIGSAGHETMQLVKKLSEQGLACCKTNEKEYDMAVMVLLIIAHTRSPESWRIGSDGGDEWKPAMAWLESLFPGQYRCPIRF